MFPPSPLSSPNLSPRSNFSFLWHCGEDVIYILFLFGKGIRLRRRRLPLFSLGGLITTSLPPCSQMASAQHPKTNSFLIMLLLILVSCGGSWCVCWGGRKKEGKFYYYRRRGGRFILFLHILPRKKNCCATFHLRKLGGRKLLFLQSRYDCYNTTLSLRRRWRLRSRGRGRERGKIWTFPSAVATIYYLQLGAEIDKYSVA